METNFIVYRDKEYTTSWISHKHADEIASYLKGKQFTVYDDVGANAFIRQYLDFGGRVVWIGDLPFSYRGNRGQKIQKNR